MILVLLKSRLSWARRMRLARLSAEHRAAFRRAEVEGLTLAFWARAVAVVAIAVLIGTYDEYQFVVYYYGLLLAALWVAGLQFIGARRGWAPWTFYLWASLDVALVVGAVILPNPFDPGDSVPSIARFHFDNVLYLTVLIAFYALSFSARLVLWVGGAAIAAWLFAAAVALSQPTLLPSVPVFPSWTGSEVEKHLAYLADPYTLRPFTLSKQVLLLALVTGTLALAVARARRLVARQAEAERERANLARYVSPNAADFAQRPGSGELRRATAAMLFVDIVGFTRLAEAQTPEQAVGLLQEFFARITPCVADAGGTLDKYLGDGLMASFGLPEAGKRDAAAALACARAMDTAINRWNIERLRAGEQPVRIGIGLHWGPVLLSEIGSAGGRGEIATLGDTVNVASRLQEAARGLGVEIVLSGALRWAVLSQAEMEEAIRLLDGFTPQPPVTLRGREQPIEIWTLALGG